MKELINHLKQNRQLVADWRSACFKSLCSKRADYAAQTHDVLEQIEEEQNLQLRMVDAARRPVEQVKNRNAVAKKASAPPLLMEPGGYSEQSKSAPHDLADRMENSALAGMRTEKWAIVDDERFKMLNMRVEAIETLQIQIDKRLKRLYDEGDWKVSVARFINSLTRLLDYPDQTAMLDRVVNIVRAFVKEPKMASFQFNNVLIMGPAGTGKTRLAATIGTVFAQLGMYVYDELVEANIGDFIAGFVGQTESKVLSFLTNNLEKVVFLDEAYSLTQWNEDHTSLIGYSAEATAELIGFLSKNVGKISFIGAGCALVPRTVHISRRPAIHHTPCTPCTRLRSPQRGVGLLHWKCPSDTTRETSLVPVSPETPLGAGRGCAFLPPSGNDHTACAPVAKSGRALCTAAYNFAHFSAPPSDSRARVVACSADLCAFFVSGYETQMVKDFLAANEGFDRRLPIRVTLGDANPNTLCSVFLEALARCFVGPEPPRTKHDQRLQWEMHLALQIKACTDWFDGTAFRMLIDIINQSRVITGYRVTPKYPYLNQMFQAQAGAMTNLAGVAAQLILSNPNADDILNPNADHILNPNADRALNSRAPPPRPSAANTFTKMVLDRRCMFDILLAAFETKFTSTAGKTKEYVLARKELVLALVEMGWLKQKSTTLVSNEPTWGSISQLTNQSGYNPASRGVPFSSEDVKVVYDPVFAVFEPRVQRSSGGPMPVRQGIARSAKTSKRKQEQEPVDHEGRGTTVPTTQYTAEEMKNRETSAAQRNQRAAVRNGVE